MSQTKTCSDFNVERPMAKKANLAHRGIMVAMCSHDYPLKGVNIKEGQFARARTHARTHTTQHTHTHTHSQVRSLLMATCCSSGFYSMASMLRMLRMTLLASFTKP
jgi:hypothetical protein